jgi:hypothetical protein
MFKHMDKDKKKEKSRRSRKKAFSLIMVKAEAETEEEEADLVDVSVTYSSVMRDLNKVDKSKLDEFMHHFKEAFDGAFLEGLEDMEGVALLQALQKCES